MERVISGLSAFAGRRLSVNERVYESELEHAHRNYAIAHMLRGHGILTGDPTVAVQGYTRQCSPMVTVEGFGADGGDFGELWCASGDG